MCGWHWSLEIPCHLWWNSIYCGIESYMSYTVELRSLGTMWTSLFAGHLRCWWPDDSGENSRQEYHQVQHAHWWWRGAGPYVFILPWYVWLAEWEAVLYSSEVYWRPRGSPWWGLPQTDPEPSGTGTNTLIVTPLVLNWFLEMYKYICIFFCFSAMNWHR